ncbi:MAG: IPT/TIG domain-containing protein [bacterium]
MTITAISPISGLPGAVVTIYGTGFVADAPEEYLVAIGDESATVSAVSATELRCTVPALAAFGPLDVTVRHIPDEEEIILPRAFYAKAVAVAPDAGNVLMGGARAVFLDGRPVGYLNGPVRLAHEVTLYEAEVEQELNPVAVFTRRERWRLTLALAEVSLENLRTVFGGGDIVDNTLGLGGAPVREYSLLVQGPGANGKLRDFYAYRAVPASSEPLLLARNQPQTLTITFLLLPEMALQVGERILRVAEK